MPLCAFTTNSCKLPKIDDWKNDDWKDIEKNGRCHCQRQHEGTH